MVASQTELPRVGQFALTSDSLGLGKVLGLDNSNYRVSFFKSVSDSFTRIYPRNEVRRAYLPPQTRVYVRVEDGTWLVGRVISGFREQGELVYRVRFPNQLELDLIEADLHVRCLLEVDDPAAILAAGGMETQFLHDRRHAALECLTTVRAESYGLTGLLSSAVELLPHQVEVVRRVLTDPIQRYMLADEVGLGKTIEACAIIRQAILDNPNEEVVVLVPSSLTGQWSRELERKFFLPIGRPGIRVVPFEDLSSIDPSEVDTLVVDEAHNLIPQEPDGDPVYALLENLALRVSRLLLLSATPVVGHERTLLALLHLLDPQVYQLENEEEFVRKTQQSREFGRVLLALNPTQRPAFLRRTIQSLKRLVPTDQVTNNLVEKIELALESGQDSTLSEDIRTLRRHVGDTYRLHQRLIRTRRRDLPDDILTSRRAILATLEEDDDERTPYLVEAIDQWRLRSLEALETLSSVEAEVLETEMVTQHSLLYEALGISVEACAVELHRQMNFIQTDGQENFEGELELLGLALNQTEIQTMDTRVTFAYRVVQSALQRLNQHVSRARLVVFSSSTEFARDLERHLRSDWIADAFLIVESSTEREVLDAVDGFRRSRYSSVLVCDRRGEEGLNLQFAHGIVHADLPLEPARIEQRVGRLDRIGRKFSRLQEISHWVMAPYYNEYHPWEAWYKLLRNGFKVFHDSISEVQFALGELQEKAKVELFRRGAVGLRELVVEVRDRVASERESLDEQYALDSRGFDLDASDTFRQIQEADVANNFLPMDVWLTEVLGLSRERLPDFPKAFRFHWTRSTLLPKQPWQEIMREEYISQPMTYHRSQAVGAGGLRLVRPGHRLLESADTLMRWDDRGTAFATWRADPKWIGEGRGTWVGFCLTYVLQSNVAEARRILTEQMNIRGVEHVLSRRMDALLPPWTYSIYMDIDIQPVTDPLLLSILKLPYSGENQNYERRDYNLSSRRDALYEAIGFSELAEACHKVRKTSEAALKNSFGFRQWLEVEGRRAINEVKSDNDRLKRRQSASLSETGREDPGLTRDIRFNDAVISTLGVPLVRLDSIGLFVVSSQHLTE